MPSSIISCVGATLQLKMNAKIIKATIKKDQNIRIGERRVGGFDASREFIRQKNVSNGELVTSNSNLALALQKEIRTDTMVF
jgi:hypothetical protein